MGRVCMGRDIQLSYRLESGPIMNINTASEVEVVNK